MSNEDNKKKLVYTNRPLKKGEKYATLKEFLEHHQYLPLYGVTKLDAGIIQKQEMKTKTKGLSRDKIVIKMVELKARKTALEKKISAEKNPVEKKKLEDQLNKVIPQLDEVLGMFKEIENKKSVNAPVQVMSNSKLIKLTPQILKGELTPNKKQATAVLSKLVKKMQPKNDSQNINQKKLDDAISMKILSGKSHDLTKKEYDRVSQLMKKIQKKPTQKPTSKKAMINAVGKTEEISNLKNKQEGKQKTAYPDSQILEIYKFSELINDRLFNEIDDLENDDELQNDDDKTEKLEQLRNMREEIEKVQDLIKKNSKVVIKLHKIVSLTNNTISLTELQKLIANISETISNLSYEEHLWDSALKKKVTEFLKNYKKIIKIEDYLFDKSNQIQMTLKNALEK